MIDYKEKILKRFARWKIDLSIASNYLSPFMTFQVLSTLVYSNVSFLKNIFPNFVLFFVISCFVFIFGFKGVAKLIFFIGLYDAERKYELRINPFGVDAVTDKEKNYGLPLTVANCDLEIQLSRLLLFWGDNFFVDDNKNWILEKQKTLKYIENMQLTRDKYESLKNND